MIKISQIFLDIIMILLFLYLLVDPSGNFGWKFITLIILIFIILCKNLNFVLLRGRIILSLLLFSFSLLFILKQEMFYFYDAYMSVIATTIGLAAVFILNQNHSVLFNMIAAMKILLISNLCIQILGFYFVDIAISLNTFLKDFQMLSLESRSHFITDYSFYHNSIYSTVMIIPLLIREVKMFGIINFRGILSFLSVCSLILTQSRSVLLAFGIYFILCFPRSALFLLSIISISLMFNSEILLDSSTNMKLSYLPVFLSQFSDWKTIMLGSGPIFVNWGDQAGTHAFIELTYLELFRYFGIVGVIMLCSIFTIYYLVYLQNNLTKQQVNGMLMYFGMISVNPYLWGITGLPLLAIYTSVKYYDR